MKKYNNNNSNSNMNQQLFLIYNSLFMLNVYSGVKE